MYMCTPSNTHTIPIHETSQMVPIYRFRSNPLKKVDKLLDKSGTLFKLLNGAFRAKIFYMKVALKYYNNLFFKFIIIKTQSIIH